LDSLDRDQRITRMNVLATATSVLSIGGLACEPDDVIALAARLEGWICRQ
jgi:hypothetical protein